MDIDAGKSMTLSPTVCLIYARAANGVIGHNNAMPWHLPEDMKHFQQLTHGHPVIMGRKTWDSLPERFRPLPQRTNIVVTRNPGWTAAGALRAESLSAALKQASAYGETIWVMGGAQIYAQALPLANSIEVTIIDRNYEGDAYAPELGPQWQEAARENHVSAQGVPFSFVRYKKQC